MVNETYLLETWDALPGDLEAKRQHLRDEIDAAYKRGFEDGRDSISVVPVVLLGAVSGALVMFGYFTFV